MTLDDDYKSCTTPVSWEVEVYNSTVDGKWEKGTVTEYSHAMNSGKVLLGDDEEEQRVEFDSKFIKLVRVSNDDTSEKSKMLFPIVKNNCEKRQIMYKSPKERQAEILKEIRKLDDELAELEKFGDTKIGILSKPFALCINAVVPNIIIGKKDGGYYDEHRVHKSLQSFDKQGVGLFERLVRTHVRNLALIRILHDGSKNNTQYANAECDLAQIYARVSLWPQVYDHANRALEIMKRQNNSNGNILLQRLHLLLGRFYCQQGNIEDAFRYLNLSMSEKDSPSAEQYLALAEANVLKHQVSQARKAESINRAASTWVESESGEVAVKECAAELIKASKESGGKKLSVKDAQVAARNKVVRNRVKELGKEKLGSTIKDVDNTAMSKASELFLKVLEVREAEFGKTHSSVASALAALGNLHIIKEELQDASSYFEKSIETFKQCAAGSENSVSCAILQTHLGRLYQHLQKLPEAKALFESAATFYTNSALAAATNCSTRREFSARALQALDYWSSIQKDYDGDDDTEEATRIHKLYLSAAVTGFGELSEEHIDALVSASAIDSEASASLLRQAITAMKVVFEPNDKRITRAQRKLKALRTNEDGA